MKWIINKINYHKTGFGIFSWVFVCVLSCFVFLDTNTYALNDLVLDFSNDAASYQTVCADNSSFTDGTICGYKYILMSGDTSSSTTIFFNIGQSGSGSYTLGWEYASSSLVDVSSFPAGAYNIMVKPSSWRNTSLVVTFTNTNPYDTPCPECEECQVCPVIPENPYDEKLDNIVNAIYACCATLLVIYFFYCIYRMIIKSVGGR